MVSWPAQPAGHRPAQGTGVGVGACIVIHYVVRKLRWLAGNHLLALSQHRIDAKVVPARAVSTNSPLDRCLRDH